MKVMWFSRHNMTADQEADLKRIYGEFELTQISKTIQNAYELQNEVAGHDVVGVVAPVNLQEQFLKIAAGKPVISCRNKRVLIKNPDGGEDKVDFVFDGWYRIVKIEVVTEDL